MEKDNDASSADISAGSAGKRPLCSDTDTGDAANASESIAQSESVKMAKLDDQAQDDDAPIPEKVAKRKVAVLLSYCGTGYSGMQFNGEIKTIERELRDAMVRTGAITPQNAQDLAKVSFIRAARTDKGVHAAGQVVSLKMQLQPNLITNLNKELPEQIRVWGYTRTNNNFNARMACDSRKYEYLLPTYALQEMDATERRVYAVDVDDKVIAMLRRAQGETTCVDPSAGGDGTSRRAAKRKQRAKKQQQEQFGTNENDEDDADQDDKEDQGDEEDAPMMTGEPVDTTPTSPLMETWIASRPAFRLSSEKLERLRAIVQCFVGWHNFHNYTIRRAYRDPSAVRQVISFTCSDPFLVDGIEWVSFRIHGQSFILHQIRKMIGMAILLMRTGTSVEILDKTFGAIKVNVPKAPALGLLLLEPVYTAYNNLCKKKRKNNLPTFQGEQLHFEDYRTDMDAFKQKWIYAEIFSEEQRAFVFAGWVVFQRSYAYTYAYLFQPVEALHPIYAELVTIGVNDPGRPIANKRVLSEKKKKLFLRDDYKGGKGGKGGKEKEPQGEGGEAGVEVGVGMKVGQ